MDLPCGRGEEAVSNRSSTILTPRINRQFGTRAKDAGILTTSADLLFSGNREGYFFALDARTGKELWKRYLGSQVADSPVTYMVDGTQYVSVAAGNSLFTFSLGRVLAPAAH